jgi:undecaprenyl-diphosphatase
MGKIVESMESTGKSPCSEAAAPAKRRSILTRIVDFDIAFLRALASLSLPRAVTLPLMLLVRIGDGWIWFLIAFYLWKSLPMVKLQTAVFHCLLAITISLILYWPIKLLAKRARPHNSGLGITPMVPPLDKYSFPSGHTMNNLAVALTVSIYMPHLFIPALLIPIAMGMLRILFGVHFFSDITGGAVLGAISYFLAKAFFPFLHV